MLKRFLPKQDRFFYFFQQMADILVAASTEFHRLLHHLNEQEHVDRIAIYEAQGDKIAHETFELLHKTFITPFDRHDIHHLTSHLDDVLDLINRCAQRFPYYQLQIVPNEMIQLAEISKQSCVLVKQAIDQLHSLKKAQEIFQCCEAIDHQESLAHQCVMTGEKKLFAEETDFKHFFKLKEIYAQTKSVINHCQDVGNIIKGILLEYS